MTYNAEQITYLLAEAIDKDKEYKSWHVSTKHLMTLVERVVAEEREACAKLCFEMWDKWMDADPSERNNLPRDAEDCASAIRARGQA